MEMTTRENLTKTYSFNEKVKGFLIWTFTLTVSLLVAGFPLIVLMVALGAIMAISLQSLLPISAVLLVAVGLIGVNVLGILFGAAVLTFKGVNPKEVRWLSWLHGEQNILHKSIFAACPLTCDYELTK